MNTKRYFYTPQSVFEVSKGSYVRITLQEVDGVPPQTKEFSSNAEIASNLIKTLNGIVASPSFSSSDNSILVISVPNDYNAQETAFDKHGFVKVPRLHIKPKGCNLVGSDSNLRELQSELVKILSQKK